MNKYLLIAILFVGCTKAVQKPLEPLVEIGNPYNNEKSRFFIGDLGTSEFVGSLWKYKDQIGMYWDSTGNCKWCIVDSCLTEKEIRYTWVDK